MTLSPDNQFIAIGGECREITIQRLSRTQEPSTLIEIDGGDRVSAVTFAANGKHLVSGGENGVRVWRVEDGEEMARMEASYVLCVAASNDGRWIAAGTLRGKVIVWDAETHETVFALEADAVDFSPDSTRLLVASRNCRATVWDTATRGRALTLHHERALITAKFSPQGDRIAAASPDSVRVYDSNDGHLLMDIKVNVTPWFSTSLLWFRNHLFVLSGNEIKQIEASTGSTVSEWPVPDSSRFSCIALPQRGEFIAHSTSRTVAFWDTSKHTQLGLIRHTQDICSITLSPDSRLIAIGGKDGEITIKQLARTIVSIWRI